MSIRFSCGRMVVSGFIEYDFFFQVCSNRVSELRFCIRAGASIMVPGIGGWSFLFDICLGINDQQTLPPEGRVDTHQWTSTDECIEIEDDDPAVLLGERQATVRVICCEDATLGIQTSGVALNSSFNVGGPVMTTELECHEPSAQVQLTAYRPVTGSRHGADGEVELDVSQVGAGEDVRGAQLQDVQVCRH